MNNLRKFATEADYSAATLNYPAVSWIVSGDTLHYDKEATPTPPPVVNDKVMIASYSGTGETNFIFYNCEALSSGDITSILFDDVEVNPITCQTTSDVDASQTHIAKYTITGTSVGDWCGGDLGCGQASVASKLDILYPSQITALSFPTNVKNMVVEAETPPYVEGLESSFEGDGIYVPDSAVNTYKSADEWGSKESIIHPISEYQGNLPV